MFVSSSKDAPLGALRGWEDCLAGNISRSAPAPVLTASPEGYPGCSASSSAAPSTGSSQFPGLFHGTRSSDRAPITAPPGFPARPPPGFAPGLAGPGKLLAADSSSPHRSLQAPREQGTRPSAVPEDGAIQLTAPGHSAAASPGSSASSSRASPPPPPEHDQQEQAQAIRQACPAQAPGAVSSAPGPASCPDQSPPSSSQASDPTTTRSRVSTIVEEVEALSAQGHQEDHPCPPQTTAEEGPGQPHRLYHPISGATQLGEFFHILKLTFFVFVFCCSFCVLQAVPTIREGPPVRVNPMPDGIAISAPEDLRQVVATWDVFVTLQPPSVPFDLQHRV